MVLIGSSKMCSKIFRDGQYIKHPQFEGFDGSMGFTMSSNNNHARRRSFSTSVQLGALCALALLWLAPAFAAGTLEYCTAPGLAIPDDSPAGVDSTLTVPYDDELLTLH